jgi:hypothetical protein
VKFRALFDGEYNKILRAFERVEEFFCLSRERVVGLGIDGELV